MPKSDARKTEREYDGRMFRSGWIALGLLLGCSALSGCYLSKAGDGEGRVDGTLYVRSCRDGSDLGSLAAPATYSMNPQFFVADPIEDWVKHDNPVNRMQIRVQATGNLPEDADVMWVTIADVALVAQQLNQPMTVDVNSNVRVSLPLNRTCRDREATPIMTGQITFTTFGKADGSVPPRDFQVRFGEDVAASFVFDVIDRRNQLIGGDGNVPVTPAVGGHLEGDFALKIVPTRSGQAYP